MHHARSSSPSSIDARHEKSYVCPDDVATPRAIIPRTTSSAHTRQGAIHSLTFSPLSLAPSASVWFIWACDAVRARAGRVCVSVDSCCLLSRSVCLREAGCVHRASKARLESIGEDTCFGSSRRFRSSIGGVLRSLRRYRRSLSRSLLSPRPPLASSSSLARCKVGDPRFPDYNRRARGDISKVKGCFPRLPDLPC